MSIDMKKRDRDKRDVEKRDGEKRDGERCREERWREERWREERVFQCLQNCEIVHDLLVQLQLKSESNFRFAIRTRISPVM
jgi:hypothetical protein